MIQLPILHTSSGDVRIEPVSASLDLELEPLSSAELELKPGEIIPERSWVSVFTEHGLAGIFRSKPQNDRYGERSSHVSLVHGAVEMNDWLTGKSNQTQTSAASAISTIFQSYGGSKWSLGTVSPSNTVVYELNNSGVLDAITEIMEQIPGYMITFDQSSTPWVMNVVARPSEVSAEGRLSRNVSSVEITRDDSSLCTRVYYGDSGAYVQDSTAVSKYGIIEHHISDSGFTAQQLAVIAQTYLDNHSEPKLSVSISAIDLYAATGETLDRITLGSKYRLAIPEADSEENRIIEQVVCSIRYDDLFSSNPQITLASEPETIITFLKKQRRAGGATRQVAKEEAEKQYQHWVIENDQYKKSVFKIMGVTYDQDGNVIYQTDPVTGEVIVDDAGNPIPVYNPESDGSIMGQVTESAQLIEQKVSVTDMNTTLTNYVRTDQFSAELGSTLDNGDATLAAKVTTLINKQTGTSKVVISADQIDLNGYVTAGELQAVDAKIETITSDTITANTYVSAATGRFGNLWVEGSVGGSSVSALVDMAINSITLSGPVNDVYTLSATRLDGSSVTIGNFNRAATSDTNLSGLWSSGKFTVTAQPQNKEYWTEITQGAASWEGAQVTIPIMATDTTSGGNSYATGRSVFLDVSSKVGSITNLSGASIAGNYLLDNVPITASGTNLNPYTENVTLAESTYQVGSITRNCVTLSIDNTVIGRIRPQETYEAGQDSVVPTFGSFTGTPSSIAQELQPGTYEFKVTKDGTTTTDQFYTVPSAPSPIVPKISRDGSWSSGSQRFVAGTTGSDDITVTIKSGAQTPTLIYSGTTVTGISFDVMENDGTSAGADTGADITATINRTSAALQLGTFDSENSKFTVSKASGGSINIGSSNAIQIGVTPLDITVEKGTATPTTPVWQGDSTHKYNINATATFTVGGHTITQNTGSISGGFEPTDAIDYGKKLAKGIQSLTVSQTSKSAYDAATNVPVDSVTGDSYYFVTATPVMGDPVTRKFHTPASGGGGSDRWARYVEDITLTADDKGESTWLKFATYNTGETETDPNHKTAINIDASEVYNAGVAAGAGGTPKVVKGAWNGNTCEFTPSLSEGTAFASVTIAMDYTEKIISDSSLSETAQIRLKDGDSLIETKNFYLKKVNASSGSFVGLSASNSLVQLTYLAKIPIDGGGGGGEQYSVASIDPIALTRNDITTTTKYPVLHYDDPSHSTQNTVPFQIDASEVYAQGLADGSRLDVETMRIVPNPLTQNTTYTLYPSNGKNVMAGIQFTVDTPTGIDSAQVYNSSDTLPSVWLKNLGEGELSKKFGQIRVDAKDGTIGYFVVDATKVYQAGVNAGSSYSVMGNKSYGTVRTSGTHTITPDDGFDAMTSATFYVDIPRIQESVSETVYPGTTTINPTGQYGAMKKAIITVPTVDMVTNRDQSVPSGATTMNLTPGHNIRFQLKVGNTVYKTIYVLGKVS